MLHLIRKFNRKVPLKSIYRTLSIQSTLHEFNGTPTKAQEEFVAVASEISQEIINEVQSIGVPELTKRYSDLLKYNWEVCEMRTGLFLVNTYKILEKPQNLTPENVKLANILGCCVQLIGNGFLYVDDFIDNSQTRYGAPCWYTNPNIGRSVANDQIFQSSTASLVLEKYFSQHPRYMPLLRLLNHLIFSVCLGQALDTTLARNGRQLLNQLTMNNFHVTAIRKNGYCSMYTPVSLAMTLAGVTQPKSLQFAKDFCLELGIFDQVVNDYFDCFGDLDVTKKDSSDIQIGKCSWLAVMAMEKASASQKKIMEEYYGSGHPQAEKIIRNLYEELKLPACFQEFRREFTAKIEELLGVVPGELPKEVFASMAKHILNPCRNLGI